MGCHTGVVAPDLVQQDIPSDHLIIGAVKELEDVRLFFSQPDLLAFLVGQHLNRRSERVGADGEDGVFRLLMLAQLRTDTRKKDGEFERLGNLVVRPGIQTQDRVAVAVMPGQHDDRAANTAFAEQATHLAAIHIWQANV